jgi:hypothetical protein
MHRAALHVPSQCFQSEEALAAVEQCLGLAHCLLAIQQDQGTAVVIDVPEVENVSMQRYTKRRVGFRSLKW